MKVGAAALAGGLVIVALASGCARDPRQATIVQPPSSAEGSGAVTPLQRGELRRDALRAAKAGLEAWRADDMAAMSKYFAKEQVDYYRKLRDETAREGRVRVRKHEVQFLDVVEMSPDGKEAVVRYKFVNRSYLRNAPGQVVEPPTGKSTQMDITMVQEGGVWRIQRMIGGKAELQ